MLISPSFPFLCLLTTTQALPLLHARNGLVARDGPPKPKYSVVPIYGDNPPPGPTTPDPCLGCSASGSGSAQTTVTVEKTVVQTPTPVIGTTITQRVTDTKPTTVVSWSVIPIQGQPQPPTTTAVVTIYKTTSPSVPASVTPTPTPTFTNPTASDAASTSSTSTSSIPLVTAASTVVNTQTYDDGMWRTSSKTATYDNGMWHTTYPPWNGTLAYRYHRR